MKRLLYKSIAALAIIIALASCDEIEHPYTEQNAIDTTLQTSRKVILEDYTGFRCGNCPAAHDVAKQIHEFYKDKVIIMAVHPNCNFTKPSTSGTKYTYDFRTPSGDAYDVQFKNSETGLPNGMVNRKKFASSYLLSHTSWMEKVAEVLSLPPVLDIKLTASYNESSRKIDIKSNLEYVDNASANNFITVVIVEDSIVNYQTDYRVKPVPDIPNYVHNHVLRHNINGTWGDQISSSAITKGAKFEKNFSYIIPNEKDWRPNKLKIIAFVYDGDLDYEVLQAEEVELIK